ncbi:hypothetical protein [Nocardia sp. NPDC059195]|uniref:hypothetical protein n=1 Tax=Nocardia sp. NPDC059195 TaxID=3346765 RepID=UPI0036AC2D42
MTSSHQLLVTSSQACRATILDYRFWPQCGHGDDGAPPSMARTFTALTSSRASCTRSLLSMRQITANSRSRVAELGEIVGVHRVFLSLNVLSRRNLRTGLFVCCSLKNRPVKQAISIAPEGLRARAYQPGEGTVATPTVLAVFLLKLEEMSFFGPV